MNEATKPKTTAASSGQVDQIVMREYSQGVAGDGAAILCDGRPMTIEQILGRLRTLEYVRGVIYDSPELNPSNYDHDQACQLNTAMCEAWSIIEADV
jgi:hypothetical protein